MVVPGSSRIGLGMGDGGDDYDDDGDDDEDEEDGDFGDDVGAVARSPGDQEEEAARSQGAPDVEGSRVDWVRNQVVEVEVDRMGVVRNALETSAEEDLPVTEVAWKCSHWE
jgi:hypothetical protein